MNFTKAIFAIFSSLFTMLTVDSAYRIFSETLGILSPRAAGLQWLYWLALAVVFAGALFALIKIQAKRSHPAKFLLILTIVLFVTWVCVVSVGLRLSRPMKGMSRFPEETHLKR